MGLISDQGLCARNVGKLFQVRTYKDMHAVYFPLLSGGELLEEGQPRVPPKYKQWWEQGVALNAKTPL